MTCGKGKIMSEKTNKVKGSRSDYLQGLKDGLPIGLGYLSVSFAFGITAVGMKNPAVSRDTHFHDLPDLSRSGRRDRRHRRRRRSVRNSAGSAHYQSCATRS